jgi:hypothetical protein
MKLNTENTSGNTASFTPVPVGVYEARVVKIAELGSQKARPPYHLTADGRPKGPSTKLSVTFELADMVTEVNGKTVPRLAFKIMTLSLHEKAHLAKIVASAGLTGEFDIADLLGTVVSLSITHTEKNGATYANVDSISAVSERVAKTVAPAETDLTIFTFDEPNQEVFEALPEFQRNMITSALNFKGSKIEALLFEQTTVGTDNVDDMDGEAF